MNSGELTKKIWDFIFNIRLGKIVGLVIVIATIITGICIGVKHAYKLFENYTLMKNENKEQKEKLAAHEDLFTELKNSLDEIQRSFHDLKEVSFKQLKYTIIRTCEEAIKDGYISSGRLSFLEEMYKEYVEIFHGNGYAKTLVDKVRTLPVVGSEQ